MPTHDANQGDAPDGWRWFDPPADPPTPALSDDDVRRAAERVFASLDGRVLLRRLRQLTIERRLGANATEPELRWLEAQRALVGWLEDQADAKQPIIPQITEQKEN
jgi:hypothetical protein